MNDRYKLEKLIGEGRAGEVYLARDTVLDRTVTIRKFSENKFKEKGLTEDWKDHFINLVINLSRLSHPNILKMIDGGIHDDGPFLITAFVEGKKLRKLIKENGFEIIDAYELAEQLLDALIVAEDGGFNHLALSDTSILASENPSGGYNYILLDLGHGKLMPLIHGDHKAWDKILKPECIAPELYEEKHYGGRTTQFIMGNLLFGLLAGSHPFAGFTLEQAYHGYKEGKLGSLLDYRVEAPKDFVEWLSKMLQPKVDDRFSSLKDALAALPQRPKRFHSKKTKLPPKSIAPDDLGFEVE